MISYIVKKCFQSYVSLEPFRKGRKYVRFYKPLKGICGWKGEISATLSIEIPHDIYTF